MKEDMLISSCQFGGIECQLWPQEHRIRDGWSSFVSRIARVRVRRRWRLMGGGVRAGVIVFVISRSEKRREVKRMQTPTWSRTQTSSWCPCKHTYYYLASLLTIATCLVSRRPTSPYSRRNAKPTEAMPEIYMQGSEYGLNNQMRQVPCLQSDHPVRKSVDLSIEVLTAFLVATYTAFCAEDVEYCQNFNNGCSATVSPNAESSSTS